MKKSLGQIAYEKWVETRPSWEDKHPWFDLSGSDRRGWEDVAKSVFNHVDSLGLIDKHSVTYYDDSTGYFNP